MTRIDEKLLIHEYKNREFLWNRRNLNFKNQPMRSAHLEQIARVLNVEKDEVKKKWRALEKKYNSEVAWERNGKKNINGKYKPYKSNWKHYNEMKFLPIDGENKEDEDEDEEEDEMDMGENNVAVLKLTENNKKRSNPSMLEDLDMMQKPQDLSPHKKNFSEQKEQQQTTIIDELTEASHEMFYDSLMPFVMGIPNEDVLIYRRELVDLINEYSDLKNSMFDKKNDDADEEECIILSDDEMPFLPVKKEVNKTKMNKIKTEPGLDGSFYPPINWFPRNIYMTPSLPPPGYFYNSVYDPYMDPSRIPHQPYSKNPGNHRQEVPLETPMQSFQPSFTDNPKFNPQSGMEVKMKSENHDGKLGASQAQSRNALNSQFNISNDVSGNIDQNLENCQAFSNMQLPTKPIPPHKTANQTSETLAVDDDLVVLETFIINKEVKKDSET